MGSLAERDLLSSVCHDLKAPLASMTMGVAFLRRVLPRNDDPTSRVVDALHRASHRMSRTIASFADLAKLQMGELELDTRPAAVGEVMQTAFDTFLSEARAEQIPLRLDVDAETSALRFPCDQGRVVQALWHLFVCVGHVLPSAGSVTLRARHADDAVRFEVEGVRAQDGAAHPANGEMPKPELTIARGLVALHGGRLDIEGDDGTLRLSFSIPVSATSASRDSPEDGCNGN